LNESGKSATDAVMSALHISKVAVGCASIETLRRRQQARLSEGVVPLVTRFMPKRAEELVGGSVFWIVKHRIAARQTILALAARESDRRTVISLCPELVPVRAIAKRAHQGWRYLAADDAPADFADCDDDGLLSLPVELAGKLSSLALI
jgi:hypothetical protein